MVWRSEKVTSPTASHLFGHSIGDILRAVPTLVRPIHGRFSRDATPVSPVGRASGPQLNASCRPVKIALRTSQMTT